MTSLSLDELIGNLKLHEMIIKKDSKIVKAKGERRSLALKAKKESSDEECLTFESKDEEYAIATFQRSRDDKNGKSARKCLRCGDPNHLIEECPKPPKDKNQRAFVGGSWSDSGGEDDEKTKDVTCLVVQASNEVGPESSYFSDVNSSIDDFILDSEYDKLSLKLTQFEKSTHSLNELLSNERPFGDKLGVGFNSLEAPSSGTKKIEFVKPAKTTSGGGPPNTEDDPQSDQTAPKANMGPPVCTPTHRSHGPRKDFLYKTPSVTAYLPALQPMDLAFLFSSRRISFMRYLFDGKFLESVGKGSDFLQVLDHAWFYCHRPAINASYSASLLLASNLNLRAYINSTPSGFLNISPAQEPSIHDDPSVNNIHGSGSSSLSSMGVSRSHLPDAP
nr:alpha/beta hydrolases superfamily protein [Tanacetum cinerariifolium]